mmetsp:Transcript_3103/g.2581  ORF Transcript_3103/g.2581 Transcript_3103/m.2581 type:complete len:137 (-) Transcript_3103:354-764(-)
MEFKKSHHRFYINQRRILQKAREDDAGVFIQKRVDSRLLRQDKALKGYVKQKNFLNRLPSKDEIKSRLKNVKKDDLNTNLYNKNPDLDSLDVSKTMSTSKDMNIYLSNSPNKINSNLIRKFSGINMNKNMSMAPVK